MMKQSPQCPWGLKFTSQILTTAPDFTLAHWVRRSKALYNTNGKKAKNPTRNYLGSSWKSVGLWRKTSGSREKLEDCGKPNPVHKGF